MSQNVHYVQSPGTVYVQQQGYPQQVVYQQGPPVGRAGGPPVGTPVQYVQQPQQQYQQHPQQVVYQQQQQPQTVYVQQRHPQQQQQQQMQQQQQQQAAQRQRRGFLLGAAVGAGNGTPLRGALIGRRLASRR